MLKFISYSKLAKLQLSFGSGLKDHHMGLHLLAGYQTNRSVEHTVPLPICQVQIGPLILLTELLCVPAGSRSTEMNLGLAVGSIASTGRW
jgi:hypothetical protein